MTQVPTCAGEMAEWLKAHAWKACLGETLTWVRIPLSPPDSTIGSTPLGSRPLRSPGAGINYYENMAGVNKLDLDDPPPILEEDKDQETPTPINQSLRNPHA